VSSCCSPARSWRSWRPSCCRLGASCPAARHAAVLVPWSPKRVGLTLRGARCRPVAFRPEHEQKLANEFLLYTNCAALAGELGGWDAEAEGARWQ